MCARHSFKSIVYLEAHHVSGPRKVFTTKVLRRLENDILRLALQIQ